MEKIKTSLLIIIVTAFAAQVNLDILVTDFKVSLGIVFLGVYLYHYRNLNLFVIGISSGLIVCFLRSLFSIVTGNSIISSLNAYYPEIFFYTAFTLTYLMLQRREDSFKLKNYFVIILVSDFIANFTELFARLGLSLLTNQLESLVIIMVVAFIRATAVTLVIIAFRYYRNILLKEEHQNRYQNLLTLTSKLKAETYWADKSLNHIETIMTKAYELYSEINETTENPKWSNDAMEIAKEIHEVKKEVGLIVRGVEEITDHKFDDQGIRLSDIFNILKLSLKSDINNSNRSVRLSFKTDKDIKVKSHYYLMSILRNLVYNSLDAIKGDGVITLTHQVMDGTHIFMICDSGSGIKVEDREFIFLPGFSTKINYETGSINRGLGLSLVKDITVNYFNGQIFLETEPGDTCFILEIDEERLIK